MAKKKSGDSNDAIRLKAKEMREAQERADRRTRNIIIGIVVVVVVAIIAALIFVVQTAKSEDAQSQSGSAVPSKFEGGKPIVVSDLGVGQRNDKLEDLTIYYSYTCHWCGILEENAGQLLFDDALAGKYNLVLYPVNTIDMAWQGPATSAALMTAAEDPDHFVAFHQSMFEYFMSQYNDQNSTVIQNLDASTAKVAELAKAAGVSDAVIAQFGESATSYLAITSVGWQSANFEDRPTRLGTPEIVFNNHVIAWKQGTGEVIRQSILDGMAANGFTMPQSQ